MQNVKWFSLKPKNVQPSLLLDETNGQYCHSQSGKSLHRCTYCGLTSLSLCLHNIKVMGIREVHSVWSETGLGPNLVLPLIVGLTISFFFFKKNIYLFLFIWLHWVLVVVCRILIPWPGMEPGSPVLGVQSLSHWSNRDVQDLPSWSFNPIPWKLEIIKVNYSEV